MREATGKEIREALRRRVTLNVTRHFMARAREYMRAPTEAEIHAAKAAAAKNLMNVRGKGITKKTPRGARGKNNGGSQR